MATISLPTKDRGFAPYTTGEPIVLPKKGATPKFNRVAYAAAHVVADPLADNDPWLDAAVDWDKTIAFREYLWDLGLGVAEAMDTAQRGMGLDWHGAKELIRRALDAAKARPGVKIACGAGTDHLDANARVSIDDIVRVYEEQIEAIEGMGGQIILMASRALARAATAPEDYARVYGRILRQVKQPVIIHWLGEMFDPALAGYWGSADHMAAMETCLAILNDHAANIDGIKISLLSKEKEVSMRRRLQRAIRLSGNRSAARIARQSPNEQRGRTQNRFPLLLAALRACACIRATISTTPSSSPATRTAIRMRCSAFSMRSHRLHR